MKTHVIYLIEIKSISSSSTTITQPLDIVSVEIPEKKYSFIAAADYDGEHLTGVLDLESAIYYEIQEPKICEDCQ